MEKVMKKSLSIMFVLLLFFLLPACGGDEEEEDWGNDGDTSNGDDNNNAMENWEITLEGITEIEVIAIDLNDKILVAGNTFSNLYSDLSGKSDPFVAKFDSEGQILWGKQWGVAVNHSSMNSVLSLSTDIEGSVYLTGYSNPFILKLSSSGTKIWEVVPKFEEAHIRTHTLDESNNVYVGIYDEYNENIGDIIKYSKDGKELQRYNISNKSTNETRVKTLAVDQEKNIYAGGRTSMNLFSENVGKDDAFLVKISPDGTILWSKQWGSKGDDSVDHIIVDNENNIYVVVNIESKFSSEQEQLLKFSYDGNKLWGTNQNCASATMCNDGNIYCINKNQIDKYNSSGKYLGSSANYEFDYFSQLTCDSKENIYTITSNNTIIKIPSSEIK